MRQLDLSYSFRDDLRSWPNNPDDMQSFVEAELGELFNMQINLSDQVVARDFVKRLGVVANYLKTLRRVDEALVSFEKIDAYINQYGLGAKTLLVNNLRRADALRYKNEFAAAQVLFETSLQQASQVADLKDYKDFALQHLGKLHFDMQNYRKALDFFYEAFELRKIKNEPDLLDSTLLAIRITESKI